MNKMDEEIREKQRLRIQILEAIYGGAKGNTDAWFDRKDLAAHFGMEFRRFSAEIDYLVRERLLGLHGMAVTLTHDGIREVEEMHTRPDESTQHFLAMNILNVGSMVDSQINQASPSASQTTSLTPSPIDQAEQIVTAVERMENLDALKRAELLRRAKSLLELLRATVLP